MIGRRDLLQQLGLIFSKGRRGGARTGAGRKPSVHCAVSGSRAPYSAPCAIAAGKRFASRTTQSKTTTCTSSKPKPNPHSPAVCAVSRSGSPNASTNSSFVAARSGRSLARSCAENPSRSAKCTDLRAPKPTQARAWRGVAAGAGGQRVERESAHARPFVIRRMVQRLRHRAPSPLLQHWPTRDYRPSNLAPPSRLATPWPTSAVGVSALNNGERACACAAAQNTHIADARFRLFRHSRPAWSPGKTARRSS